MISEKYFIENYRSFWDEIFPGITNFVRKINKLKTKDCVIEETGVIKSTQQQPELIGFVNDIAFYYFEKEMQNSNIKLDEDVTILFVDLQNQKKYKFYNNTYIKDMNILYEFEVIGDIKQALIKKYKDKNPIIFPEFYGCGSINQVSGDIIYSDTLVEVKARSDKSEKAKSAGFRSDDLIQLFIYGALYYSEQRTDNKSRYGTIKNFELFNPRLGYCWKDDIETISEQISGGSSTDVFDEIIRFISYTNTSL